MVRRCRIALLLFASLLTVTAWRIGRCETPETRVIRVMASGMTATLVHEWAARFMEEAPGTTVLIFGAGYNRILDSLVTGDAELAVIAGRIPVDRLTEGPDRSIELSERLVGYTALAVITAPACPVKELSLDSLRRIFTGDISDWQQVGGPDAPLRALTRRPQESLASAHFQEQILEGRPYGPTVRMLDSWSAVVKVCTLAKDLPIGLAPALPLPSGVNLIGVKAMERTPAALPTGQAIAKGSYPLLMPIRFYWDPGRRDQRVAKFVEYCNAQGLGSAPDRPRHASGTGVARMLLVPPITLTR